MTSGIRVGTSVITARGMKEDEAREIGAMILKVLASPENATVHAEVFAEVKALTDQFPIYVD